MPAAERADGGPGSSLPGGGAASPEGGAGAAGSGRLRGGPRLRGGVRHAGRRLAALLQLLALCAAVLCAGIWLGGHPAVLPSFAREAFEADGHAQATAEALETIADDYYRPLSRSALASASISGAIASLHDPFSRYLDAAEYHSFASAGSFSGVGLEAIGVHAGLRIEHVFDASPAQRAGLKIGEVIVAVNGRSLLGLAEEAARELIRGRAGTIVALTVRGTAGSRTLQITRALVAEPEVSAAIRMQGKVRVGLIYLASFSSGVGAEMREAVARLLHQGAQALVLDMRHNGGGLVAEARTIASLFISNGVIVTMRSRIQPVVTLTAGGGAIAAELPMAVLVDRDTASAAEIVTAALQDHHRARVVGTRTFGKGVFQELLPLSNGGALDITVGEYFTPDGRNLGGGGVKEGAGITPELLLAESAVDGESAVQSALRAAAAKIR